MPSLFTHRDDNEGKIGIGQVPSELRPLLRNIADEYYDSIPDKNASTYHTWYGDMSTPIKKMVDEVQASPFWKGLCDKSSNCTRLNARDMDELYFSNPKKGLKNINLYGASGNYDMHQDCIFSFNGVRFYRVLIGLTDGNDNVITKFNNFGVGHKLNAGDYIAFDFDNTTHQVIKERPVETPRIMLKLHYIVCENCKHSKGYIEFLKNVYITYESITRYVMQTGTDPQTYYEFFWGVLCQYYMQPSTKFVIAMLLMIVLAFQVLFMKIKVNRKNAKKLATNSLLFIFTSFIGLVTFYWARFKLTGIK